MEHLSGYLEIPSNCVIKCHSWDLELTCSIHWASFVPNKWVCRNVKYGPEWQPVWLYHHIALITIWHTSLIASNQPPLPPLNPLHISAIFFPGIHKCVVSSGYVTLGNVPYSALFPAFFFQHYGSCWKLPIFPSPRAITLCVTRAIMYFQIPQQTMLLYILQIIITITIVTIE